MQHIAVAFLLSVFLLLPHAARAQEIPPAIQAAVSAADRTADDRALDAGRKPAELLTFLGIRPGMRVAIINVDDPDIRSLIAERTTELTEGWPEPDTDVVLLGADDVPALAPLEALAGRIRPAGAIWVVSRKGKAATLRDVEVMQAAREAGLVDNKVASFSATHTSIRLVIPLARRPR